MSNESELYACLYVREFPAQSLLRLRQEMHDKPCVVMEGEAPAQFVCSLNMKARRLQIAHGMTRVEVDSFTTHVLLSRSLNEERATRNILLECAGTFSPRVEDISEGITFLSVIDIAGTQSLFGSPEMLARMLLQRVRSVGISACVTISSNFHTAVFAAKGLSPNLLLWKISRGDESSALAPLPLSVLTLTELQAETFAIWGIRTLGMLAALPERELIARMGQVGNQLRLAARGELPHLFQPFECPFILEETIELDTPVELLEPLLFVLGAMLEQLIVRAQARILALVAVTVGLTLHHESTHCRTVRTALPTNEKYVWIKLLHLDLNANPPQAAILAVALTAEPGTASKMQQGLFSPQLPEATRLDVTLARIRALVGENCAGRPVLLDSHAEEAFRIDPFTVCSKEPFVMPTLAPQVSRRQLRPPEVVSITGRNSKPEKFLFREIPYIVERAYGPWLISGDWWNPTLWGFEQWDIVAHTHGGIILCCCLMRDLTRNQWQVTALYD